MLDNLDWLFDYVTTIRRHIHRNPELGHAEIHTSIFVEECLRVLGCFEIFRPAPTSVAAFAGAPSADMVVLRADLDALPMDEQTNAPHASAYRGVTHACGHDGHVAALLGAAAYLAREGLPKRPVPATARSYAGSIILPSPWASARTSAAIFQWEPGHTFSSDAVAVPIPISFMIPGSTSTNECCAQRCRFSLVWSPSTDQHRRAPTNVSDHCDGSRRDPRRRGGNGTSRVVRGLVGVLGCKSPRW